MSLKKTTTASSNRIDSGPGQVLDLDEMHANEGKDGQIVSSDMDVAAQYADRLGEEAYTKKEARSLLWKIDLRLIPILFLNISLPSVDKITTCKHR